MNTGKRSEALESFGALFGVDAPTVVAAMGTVFRGVGGPGNELNFGTHDFPLPGIQLGLVSDPGNISAVIDCLLIPVRKHQQNAREQFARLDAGLLEAAWRNSRKGDLSESVATDAARVDSHFHLEALLGHSEGKNGIRGELHGNTDFEPDIVYRRLEFLVRHRFLIENARIAHVKRELGSCHVGSGLIVGGQALHLKNLDKNGVATLLELIEGTRLPLPEILSGPMKGATFPSDGTFVISGELDDWANPEVQALRSRLLLVDHQLQAVPESIDGPQSQGLLDAWGRMLALQLRRRKVGIGSFVGIPDEKVGIEFIVRHLEYKNECTQVGLGDSVIRDLPLILARVLLEYFRDVSHSKVLEVALAFAEDLRDRHVMIERRLRGQAEVARVTELAVKIRQRVAERGTTTLRELVRSFDVQKTGIYLPVLELMVQGGLLVEPKPKTYGLGSEDDVAGIMRRLVESNHLRLVA